MAAQGVGRKSRRAVVDSLTLSGEGGLSVRPSAAAAYTNYDQLFADRGVLPRAPVTDREAQLARLEAAGMHAVAEEVAQGRLLIEIARELGVSTLVLREWWGGLPRAVTQAANEAAAEANMLKAELVLSSPPGSKEDAAVQVALAGHFQKVAQAVNPAQWNAGKAKPQDVAAATIMLASNMPGLAQVLALPENRPVILADPAPDTHPPPVKLRSRDFVLDDGAYDGG
jgi:hypothetical protein